MPKKASPGVSGAISDAIDAVKSYAGYGKRNITGNVEEDKQLSEEDDGSHSSTVPSNAGRTAQSSDASNQY